MSSSDRSQLKTRATISLTADLHEDLRQLADRRLSSVSQVVRELVREGVDREKQEAHAGGR